MPESPDQHLQSRAIEASSHGVVITNNDADLTIHYVNAAFEKITGFQRDAIINHSIIKLIENESKQSEISKLRLAVKEKFAERAIIQSNRKDGSVFWVEVHLAPMFGANQEISHFMFTIMDVTERKVLEAQLLHQASYDNLTDLPNRALFQERANQAIIFARREHKLMSILFIDIDRFKLINDSLGHKMGDLLLCAIAQRLQTVLRATDTVARFSGDEFVVILPAIKHSDEAVTVAKMLRSEIRKPFHIEERELNISASIGIAIYPKDGLDTEALIRNADTAMYSAKENGRDNFQFYKKNMDKKYSNRLLMQNNLGRALERNEFSLCYQPIYNLQTGFISSVESLIRWNNPELGAVSPAEFVPLAEEMGIITAMGEWVLRTASLQALQWQAMGIPPIDIAVNVSARQMQKNTIIDAFTKVIQEVKINPENLIIELTEGTLMDNTEEMLKKLNKFRSMGIKLAIDDFGTVYSSLSYLKQMPVTKVKIDKVFINDIGVNRDDETIIVAIIALCKNMKLKVVAEGVQTEEQLVFLKKYQCDEVQGFYFSEPLIAEDCTLVLKENYRLL